MRVLVALWLLFCVGCGASVHHQLTTALNNADEQERGDASDTRNKMYYRLIDTALDSNQDREVALLWHAAVVGRPDVNSYILEKWFISNGSEKYNKLVHMLRHHPDLWGGETVEVW